MAETVDGVASDEAVAEESPGDEDAGADGDGAGEAEEVKASELLEQVGRDASTLVLREVQLATSHHIPALRRAVRDITVLVGVVVAFATAFALANWALVDALSSPLPGWRAPLVLMAIWVAIGGLLSWFVLARTGRLVGWRWWREVAADPADAVRDREQARDAAENAMQESLRRFAGAIAQEAGVLVTAAVVPLAGGAADAGEKVLDAVDQVTDVIDEKVPGGGVINRVTDIALKPGRYALDVVNKNRKRDEPPT